MAVAAGAGNGVDVADAPQAMANTKSKAPNIGKTVLRFIIDWFNVSAPLFSVVRLFQTAIAIYSPQMTPRTRLTHMIFLIFGSEIAPESGGILSQFTHKVKQFLRA